MTATAHVCAGLAVVVLCLAAVDAVWSYVVRSDGRRPR